MREQIRIKVERFTDNPQKPIVTLFERVIDNDSSLSVPYASIVEIMRFMYPDSIVSVSSSLV